MNDKFEDTLCNQIASEERCSTWEYSPVYTTENHNGAVRGLTMALQLYRIHKSMFDETEGQDRESYTDDQDRESYAINENIKATIEGQPINNKFISSFISYLLTLFLERNVKGVAITENGIQIQLKRQDEDVDCKFCDRPCHIGDTQLHQGKYVCNDCWDERLKTTE